MRCAECGTKITQGVTINHDDGSTEKYCVECAVAGKWIPDPNQQQKSVTFVLS